jgi:hypothetical protein
MISRFRDRLSYFGLAVVTVAIGLAVHFRGDALPPAARDMIGDALWAVMMMWLAGAAAPAARLATRSALALAFCFAIEFSQLYHAPMLDGIRAGAAGHLVLGSGFDPRDLVAYALGVAAAAFLEWMARPASRAADDPFGG